MSNYSHRVTSLEKALDILELLNRTKTAFTVTEISRSLGIAKSSAHGLLMTLKERGYLSRDADGKFSLGYQAMRFGFSYLQDMQLGQTAAPWLEKLSRTVDETCHLAVIISREAVYVEKVEKPGGVRLVSQIGGTAALHASAVGKTLLAWLPETQLEEMLALLDLQQFTPFTITEPQELRRHLASIRERGYAVDNQEELEGVRCIGAPLRDYSGRVVAAISVSGLIQRLPDERVPTIAEQLVQTARAVSRDLGYHDRNPG